MKLYLEEDTSVCNVPEEDYYNRQILITVTVFSTTEASKTVERRGTLVMENCTVTLDAAAQWVSRELLTNLPTKKLSEIQKRRSGKHD